MGLLGFRYIRLMDKILHDPKDPKLWELWYIPYYGSCRILSISRRTWGKSRVASSVFAHADEPRRLAEKVRSHQGRTNASQAHKPCRHTHTLKQKLGSG